MESPEQRLSELADALAAGVEVVLNVMVIDAQLVVLHVPSALT